MTRIRLATAIAVFAGAVVAIVEACTTNNPGTQPYASSGASSGSAGGQDGGSSGDGGTSSSGSISSASCPGPTRYIDPHGDDGGPACLCAGNSYSVDGGACTCESTRPTLCNYDSGQPPQCVDPTIDPFNCGACGVACKPNAACIGNTCGSEPAVFVAPAPGCISIRATLENGIMYWADMGHGMILSKPVASGDGGATTMIASGVHIAAGQTPSGALVWPAPPGTPRPFATSILVHNGTVFWIGAADTPAPANDAGTIWSGGVGTTIMSASAGTAPKTILSAAMAPGPSPVSTTDAMFSIEKPGQNPPILAMAFSPDFKTIYFAAGTRYYSIPASGAVGAPTYVGYSQGPEHGEATALAADSTYLYAPTNLSGNVEILKIGSLCAEDAGPWSMGKMDNEDICPPRIARSQGNLVFDTIVVRGGDLYWGNDQTVRKGDVTMAIGGTPGGYDYPSPVFPGNLMGGNLTGFAIGPQYAYYGVDGYIEKGATPPYDGSNPNSIIVARGQPQPGSFVLDGTNVYWTTSNCDINYIQDTPQ